VVAFSLLKIDIFPFPKPGVKLKISLLLKLVRTAVFKPRK